MLIFRYMYALEAMLYSYFPRDEEKITREICSNTVGVVIDGSFHKYLDASVASKYWIIYHRYKTATSKGAFISPSNEKGSSYE